MKSIIPDTFVVKSSYDTGDELVTTTKEFDYLGGALEEFRLRRNYCGNFSKWIVILKAVDSASSISMIIDAESY